MAILPAKLAADMQAASQRWMFVCPNCGFERSYWEVGGIRWKAAGNPRNLLRCPNCGRNTWHITDYKATPDAPLPLDIARKVRKS
jgi:predicted RNA-binding Zn-ribbon protein involved in translation (DUF1610 family)